MKKSKFVTLRHLIFNRDIWAHILFWTWNALFVAFMLLGFAPIMLPDLFTAVEGGDIPTSFLLYALLLTSIPLVVTGLGIYLRHDPGKLFALGYGLEAPLMTMILVRFFIVRELTPMTAVVLGLTSFGLLTLLWQLLDTYIDKRPRWLTAVRLVGLTLLLFIGLYASIWLAFYVLPFGVMFFSNLPSMVGDMFRSLSYGEWRWIPFTILLFVNFTFTASLLVLMPLAVPVIYLRAWGQAWQTMRVKTSVGWAAGFTAVALLLPLILLPLTNRHPQQHAFAQLQNPPANQTEARALLDQERQLRAGLLNAYLAPYRYFSAAGEVDHIRQIYDEAFDLAGTGISEQVQAAYEGLAAPLLYQPVRRAQRDQWGNTWQDSALRREPERAAKLYEDYFDQTIVDGEKEAVLTAVGNSWDVMRVRTDLQALDDRSIWLAEQNIAIQENGDWADVQLYEVYVNQTNQRQEVVYYFSLPEAAVLTGVWLGNSADKSRAFTYQVAPRGAAQATYRNEVQRNVDPALLEQIGPRQYRLRVFPIEPRQWDWNSNSGRSNQLPAPPLHLWLTYRTLANEQGHWPLPALAEKRNVYWTDETVRQLNGRVWDVAHQAETWLPTAVSATFAVEPQAHRVELPDGRVMLAAPAQNLPSIPTGGRIALVLDRSYSMEKVREEVQVELNALRSLVGSNTAVDLILSASPQRGEAPSRKPFSQLDDTDLFFFGGQNAAQLLTQFHELAGQEPYDLIVVLTDSSGYKLLADAPETIPMPTAPVWMVHLGGLSLGYDDGTLEVIQGSGGGTAVSITEALHRWAVASGDLLDGYTWQLLSPAQAEAALAQLPNVTLINHEPDSPFMALAARQLILHEMAANQGDLSQLATLDALHELAVQHSIVTPYSSMIVLINDRQQQLLDELSEGDDRFAREYEAVGETAGEQLTVTGVPEPHEWLLIFLGLALLAAYFWRQQGHGRVDHFAV